MRNIGSWYRLAFVGLAITFGIGACGDSGGGGGNQVQPDTSTEQDTGNGGIPDTGLDFDTAVVDTGNPPEDVQQPDDTAPPDDTGGTNDVGDTADSVQPDDIGQDAEIPDDSIEPEDAGTEEDTGPVADIPVGEPCGPGIGTCIAGASCIEIADGAEEKKCYAPAEAGDPCGPGFGLCVAGTTCATPPDGGTKMCMTTKAEGEPCGGPGEACVAGTICVAGDEQVGWTFLGAWKPAAGSGELNNPAGLTFTSDQEIWVTDSGNSRMVVFDLAGAQLATLAGPGTALGELNNPGALGFVSSLGVFVSDINNGRIVRYSANTYDPFNEFGSIGDQPGQFGVMGPGDTAITSLNGLPAGIFVTDPSNNRIIQFSNVFEYVNTIGTAGSGDGQFTSPHGMFTDGTWLWVVDSGNKRVQVVDGAGNYYLSFGGPEEEKGGLVAPMGIDGTSDGSLFAVADPQAGHVALFAADGLLLDVLDESLVGSSIQPVDVVFAGELIVIADQLSDSLLAVGPQYSKSCVKPKGVGETCSAEIPCVSGLTCLPTYPGFSESICKTVLKENESCGKVSATCGSGLDCVQGPASQNYKWACKKAAAIGQPCGPGIGGCVEGAGCNFEGPEHKTQLCYPDIAPNGICNVYAVGDCPAQTTCERETFGSQVWRCKPNAKLGEKCGAGLAGCEPWLSCYFNTLLDQRCFEFTPIGDACGIGAGDCEPGSFCSPVDAANTAFVCTANEDIGQPCAGPGQGLCDEEKAICIAMGTGINQCLEKTSMEGDACGDFGVPPCIDGTTCIIDTPPPAATASCYADGLGTEACGAGGGTCDAVSGFGCFITDDAKLLGDCRPLQPPGQVCGEGIDNVGACDLLTGACTCANPFKDQATCTPEEIVCITEVGVFDFCAVNAVPNGPYPPGWIGLCPAGTICSAADGDGTTYLLFQCKLAAELGDPCGLIHACDEGVCKCGTQNCTIAQIKQGDVGVCAP
ncbi:MAG: hypothetical protein HUU55_19815 [Myxococcales bacterium]|nr:hypothetical protein [Myxococcales bacterium]